MVGGVGFHPETTPVVKAAVTAGKGGGCDGGAASGGVGVIHPEEFDPTDEVAGV